MEWEERAKRVIDHYRLLYGKYKARIPRRPDHRVPQDRALAERYLRWCDKRDADELLFMEERFRHLDRCQRAVPMFRALCSEKVMECWKKGGEYRALEERASESIMSRMLPAFDQSILDLSRMTPDQERYRQRHFLRATQRVCMFMPEYSGGYHPESKFCPQCPCGPECVERLNGQWNFNVVALRSGRFDLVPPQVAKIAAQG